MSKYLHGKVFILALLLALLALAPQPFTLAAPPSQLRAVPDAPLQPQAAIPACDPIDSDATWTTGNIYVVQNCNLVIAAGATLTIQPGVIVKFWGTVPGSSSGMGSAAVIVDGTLNAIGTALEPIIFTSYADDAHGGDTNSNSASNGTAGDWYGFVFRPGSTGHVEHFLVSYAGSGAFNATLGWGGAQIDVRAAAVILRHGTITDGRCKGVYLEGTGLTPVIEDVHVAANNDPTVNKRGYAIYQDSINMQPTYSALTFSDNDRDEVTIGRFNESMTQSVTLGGARFGFFCGYTLCDLIVSDGITLTVNPGTLLDFRPSFGIAVADGGALIAEGTLSRPITFTSQLAASGTPNQNWIGLWAQRGSTLRLDQCDISYASDGNFGNGGLEIDTNDAQISNCQVHHNAGYGLYIYSRDASSIHPILVNVDVTDNGQHGVYMGASSGSTLSVTWDGGSISSNGWSGVAAYTSNSTVEPTLRNLAIADNGATGASDDRRAGIHWNMHNVNPTLENLSITGNVGAAMLWYCNGSITARNLTASGNGADELEVPGCSVSGGRQWDLGGAGIPVRVDGHINVESNGLLSILPGTTLQFDRLYYSTGNGSALTVNDQAALYALGTADEPVVFTGATAEPGWWAGIQVANRATVTLRHCEIAYGGGTGLSAGLEIRWGLSGGVPAANIQNCEIHHSGKRGVLFNFNNYQVSSLPVFRYNSIHDNVGEGVANWDAPALDARDNWWDDASGPYHPTTNPGGQGDSVGDNIIFYPWLSAPSAGGDVPGEMLVSTGAPRLVSPGQTVDYAIQYLNLMTGTVQNGLLVVQLPRAAEYAESTGGGIYSPERDQVFWKLGDLVPGAQNFLSFRVRFAWGLPRDYSDSSITLFTGDNYNPGGVDAQPYLDYQPGEVNDVSLITQAQLDAQLAASPALQAAYNAALAAGYTFHSAANVTRSEGETVLEAVLVDSGRRAARILAMQDSQVLVYTVNSAEAIIEDSTGGMRLGLLTGEKSMWGDWDAAADLSAASLTADGCTPDACKRNCRWSIVGWEYIKKKAGRVIAWTALAPFTGGGSVAGAVWEIGSTVKKVYDCDLDCRADPSEYCCTAGQVRWSGSSLWDRFTNSCYREKCNATVGMWVPDGYKSCVEFGERCVAGIGGPGCTQCEERNAAQRTQTRTVTSAELVSIVESESVCSATAAGSKPSCRGLSLLLAKDPNAIYGPAGDLLPGDVVTYTITYENEGAGRAYGVYVVNPLAEAFDESTLSFLHGNGTYLPESREIVWLVGELGPKGALASEGIITYTVSLTGSLPSGTVVSNQATVFFPSVPEETPTNTWVNLVLPLAATPQNLATASMMPLAITLRGRDVSGLPLTYEIVDDPHGGTLTGTAPDLVYTPSENFTGADDFTFQVSNGTSTSRAAQVYITVTSVGDVTPPQVLWTNPPANATDVTAPVTPVLTDTIGPVYSPVILIGVSEALSETTVTSTTVTLAKEGSTPVLTSVRFDGGTNQIVLTPRVALSPGDYAATVTTGVTDLAGNPLAGDHLWSFSTGAPPYRYIIYLPLVLRNP